MVSNLRTLKVTFIECKMRSIQYLNDVSKSAMKEMLKVQAMQKLQCSTSHKGSEGRSVKGTSHDSIFQFSLFSTLADIFAV